MAKQQVIPTIILIDLNCFYAQVEILKEPQIKNCPVGVYQKHHLVTTNYVARDRGVTKGLSVQKGLSLCSDLILKNGENLDNYRNISDAFIHELSKHFHNYEVPIQKIGLDEAFLDVSLLVDLLLNDIFDILSTMSLKSLRTNVLTHNNSTISSELLNEFFPPDIIDQIFNQHKLSVAGTSICIDPLNNQGYCALEIKQIPICITSDNNKIDEITIEQHIYDRMTSMNIEEMYSSTVTNDTFHLKQKLSTNLEQLRIACASHICSKLRHAIKKSLHLSTSAGISSSKVGAKLISKYIKKPETQCILFPEALESFIKSQPLHQIPGVGPSNLTRLQSAGMSFVKDLFEHSLSHIIQNVDHQLLRRLLLFCKGYDFFIDPVVQTGSPKSISLEDSFWKCKGIQNKSKLNEVTIKLLLKLIQRQKQHTLRYQEVPSTIRLSLRYRGIPRRVSRQAPIPDDCVSKMTTIFTQESNTHGIAHCQRLEKRFVESALSLLERLIGKTEQLSVPVHLLNVSFTNFRPVRQEGRLQFGSNAALSTNQSIHCQNQLTSGKPDLLHSTSFLAAETAVPPPDEIACLLPVHKVTIHKRQKHYRRMLRRQSFVRTRVISVHLQS